MLEKFRSAPVLVQLFIINVVIYMITPWYVVDMLAVDRADGFTIHSLYQIFTSFFLHGSWMHLFGNFFFFLPAALYMERKLGKESFLKFYLAVGACSSILWILSGLLVGRGAAIGSSGAIYGVVAGALMLLGMDKNVWKKWAALGGLSYCLIVQLLLSCVSLIQPMGIAYWGHLGGILGALLLLPIFFVSRK